jgi:hypothetical protein
MAVQNGRESLLCSGYTSMFEDNLLRYKSFIYKNSQQQVKEGVYRMHLMRCCFMFIRSNF